jgi:hypothetical protein
MQVVAVTDDKSNLGLKNQKTSKGLALFRRNTQREEFRRAKTANGTTNSTDEDTRSKVG